MDTSITTHRERSASRTRRPRASATFIMFVLIALVFLAAVATADHFAGPGGWTTAAIGGVVGILAGLFGSRRLCSIAANPAASYLAGVAISSVAVVLRSAPWLVGSENAVLIAGHPVVVGEVATVLAIIGTGAMLSSLASDGRRMLRYSPRHRPFVRVAGFVIAMLPLLPFVIASAHDLGPLVVLVGALVVMGGRSLDTRSFIVVAGVFVVWLGLIAVSTVSIAQQRFAETMTGGYQLDVARLAIGSGGLLWGGGFDSNAFAESIPVAESDHLAAYLTGTFGVVPFLLLVSALFFVIHRVSLRLTGRPNALVVASTGLVVALSLQLAWTVLGSYGLLALTGLPMPGLAASGSSWLAWGIASGFLLGTVRSGRAGRTRRARRAVHPSRNGSKALGNRVGTWVSRGILVSGVITVVVALVTASGLVLFPGSAGISGAYASIARHGELVTSDGVVLAATDDSGRRLWPLGEKTVELVGAIVPSVNQYGLEKSASAESTCGGGDFWTRLTAGLVTPRCIPATVVTTVDSRIQEAAVAAASVSPGSSVVVMDGRDLDLLAAYSSPSTGSRPDPNGLSTGELSIESFSPDDGQSPFYPTVLAERVSPGSVFKLPVLAVAAQAGLVTGETLPDGAFDPELLGVHNSWDGPCPSAEFPTAIADSCNTVTAAVASALGADALEHGLHDFFGLDGGTRTLDGAETAAGTTGLAGSSLTGDELSRTAIGLESVRLTMPELAEIVAHAVGLDNDAVPGMIAGVCRPGAETVDAVPRTGEVVGQPLDDDVVQIIRSGMEQAVTDGTAMSVVDGLELPEGTTVLAKTGTPDRLVGDSWVNDSLIAVVLDHYVIVARVPGTPENPTPNVDIPASTLARQLIVGLLAVHSTIEQPTPCLETRP